MSIQEKIDRFNVLQKKSNLEEKEKQEMNHLAEEFLAITKQTYDNLAIDYSYADRSNTAEVDVALYDKLFETAENILNKPISEMSILDVGTGPGKSIKYIQGRGVKEIIGLDNSDGMISLLKELEGNYPENIEVK